MPTVYFETFGCQMNVADSDSLAQALCQYGYTQSNDIRSADLVIVNTCSVRDKAEQTAKRRLREIALYKKKQAPGGGHQTIWVVGCMAQRLGDSLKSEIPGIDRVIGAPAIETIHEHIAEYLDGRPVIGTQGPLIQGVSAFVPVMRGCDNYCSYCIVPYVRGREHSVAAQQLEKTLKQLVDKGTKEVTLLGQNVNSYRDDALHLDFSGLLQKLHAVKGIERIRFTTSHPKDCDSGLIQTVAQLPKVCKHIHLPLQSGSTKILRLMNRQYGREECLRTIDTIKKHLPHADITTDIMTGFPGETDRDFDDTLSLVKHVRFTTAFMFVYSERPGTTAATIEGAVPRPVGLERLARLIEAQTAITRQQYESMVGKTIEVLFTGLQSKRDPMWMGQDYGCKRCLYACKNVLAGTILTVKVKHTTGQTLICE